MGVHIKEFSCISFDSYIKPQLLPLSLPLVPVVYLLIPTSNHNLIGRTGGSHALYIFWFLHQTTTFTFGVVFPARCISFDSYIKPQLTIRKILVYESCISFDSYIKPQLLTFLMMLFVSCISFDSYIKPQHLGAQTFAQESCISFDSYIKPQLTYYLSCQDKRCISFDSYIKPQLIGYYIHITPRCISFDSYIKPQLLYNHIFYALVVYLLIPTSNHNLSYAGNALG